MSEIRLPLPGYAYNFDLLLEIVRRFAYPARMLVEGAVLWRFTCGRLLAYQRVGASLVVRGDELANAEQAAIARKSLQILGLNRDLSAFYDHAAKDERLWHGVEPLLGLPLFCTETVFEALVTLVIEQHISWKAALRAQCALMRLFGPGELVADDRCVYDFPSPAQLAAASPSQLKPLKITDRRCALIIELARRVDSGALDLEAIADLDDSAACASLMQIKGVGTWTAGNVIGRAFGRYPLLAENDVALQAAVRAYFHDGDDKKSADMVRQALGAHGPYAGMAGHFVLLRWVLDRYPPQMPNSS
ncbi:MAG: hypothetical protein OXE46_07000 [Chloroflexi bacterium]|nr:hypothetical protein [Chloroflexota bacterium]